MNFGPLRFTASLPLLIFGLVVLALGLYLAWTAWRRAARPKRTGALEILRVLCICLGVFILWKPEWVTTVYPSEEPETLILWDASGSMITEDATLDSPEAPQPRIITREAAVKELLATKFWKPLEKGSDSGKVDAANKARISVESFASVSENSDPTKSGTNLHEALSKSLETHPNLRSVILISDGDYNLGDPPVSAAGLLRSRGVPIYTVPMGSQRRLPDLVLEDVNAPTYGIVGENVQIPFSITSSLDRPVKTTVRMRSKDGRERSKSITIPANGIYRDSIIWRLHKKGITELTLSVPFTKGELLENNNGQTFNLNGRPESIRALVIDTQPRWEYRFIRNALSRDPGVTVDCLLLHPRLGPGDGPDYIQEFPEKLEELQKYDVVFLGDIGIGAGQLTKEQANLLAGLVKNQASGIVFIPGPQGNQFTLKDSDLADLLPVVMNDKKKEGLGAEIPASLELTSEGRGSLLTMLGDTEEQNPLIWKSLPGFYWHAPVERAKSGAQVLAVHGHASNSYGRLPLLVTSRAGSGKVLFMGIDSAWRWRRGVEDLYHYRFWGQVARWMSYQRNMAAGEEIRLYHTPERPKTGNTLVIRANGFDPNGAPLAKGPIHLDITTPDGKKRRMNLEKDGDTWGAFQGSFKINQTGKWILSASIPKSKEKPLVTNFTVPGIQLEKSGQPARHDVLREISNVSRGQLIEPHALADLVTQIQALPEASPRTTIISIWSHWITATILILLLALFWIGRKLNGTF